MSHITSWPRRRVTTLDYEMRIEKIRNALACVVVVSLLVLGVFLACALVTERHAHNATKAKYGISE